MLLGYFADGLRNGEGVFVWKTKDRYSGQWVNGKKQGKGTYIVNKTNVKISGDWVSGLIQKGRWILPNGDYYEGEFKDNFPFGRGVWTKGSDTVIEGEYSHKANEFLGHQFPKVKSEFLNQAHPAIKIVWTEI